jgi:UDP-GlcNAc:undecaprenyl-phosphate/decaprenyl-phosphate GlcNAc-1-phosphate transferase
MSQYKTYLVMLLVSGLGSWLLTPWAIRLAHRWGAVDQPDPRKIHRQPMPRLGGVAVFLGFFLPWAGLYFIQNPVSAAFQDFEKRFAGLLFGAAAMLALGVYDDLRGANALKKFFGQTATAVVLWFLGFRIDDITNPWGGPIALGWWSLPLSVLWIVGVTNAINLLDGIDGLVAGVTALIAISLAIINVQANHILVALLTTCLAGACLGFLPYNHSPAKTFLGDSGSLTIGMVLACTSILSFFEYGRQAASPLISVPLILFGLPLFDTARVMLSRLGRGVSMFKADKNHIHHRLLSLGLNQRQTAWALYAVAAGTGAMAVLLSRLETGRQLVFSVLFAGLAAGIYTFWKFGLRARVEGDEDEPG